MSINNELNFKEKFKKEELEELGIILRLDKIDESKIDLSIRPAHECIISNLCKQFNIPYPKSFEKRVYVGDLQWTEKCINRFEEIMSKKIKSAFGANNKYSWFRLQFYPSQTEWFENDIKPEEEAKK